jgi:diadenosine tetraphosphate (Ap4A) HIT family hydrolase
MDDLTQTEIEGIFDLRICVKPVLEEFFDADGFNYAWNEGQVAGQTVPHLHLHMLPRRKGDTGVLGYDPRQFFYRPGPRDCSSITDLSFLAIKIRGRLYRNANGQKAS